MKTFLLMLYVSITDPGGKEAMGYHLTLAAGLPEFVCHFVLAHGIDWPAMPHGADQEISFHLACEAQ